MTEQCVGDGEVVLTLQFRPGHGHTFRVPTSLAGHADPDTLAPAVSESALSVSCSPSLFPIKTRVFSSSFLRGRVFVSTVCLGMIFATRLKETFIYRTVQGVSARIDFLGRNRECLVRTVPAPETYCVAQSCRVCVDCNSCTVIFFVFFMIMIREYRACFILHST